MYKANDFDVKKTAKEIIGAAEQIKKCILRNPLWLSEHVACGAKVLFEGAQASMLDVVKGTVPYVTSSHTIAGSAYVGGDLPPKYHRKTIGVAKAIMSRVGNGPFVSEFGGTQSEEYCAEEGGKKHSAEFEKNEYSIGDLLQSNNLFKIGIALRILGGEYGATTKRPRRIGMLDLVLLRNSCMTNGVDELYLNKVDCLTDFSRINLKGIPIVEAYELDEERINYVPGSTIENRKAKPVITYLPKISGSLSDVKDYKELTAEAKEFIAQAERKINCKIKGIGVGPKREEFILID